MNVVRFSLLDPRYSFQQRLGLGNLALACKRLEEDGSLDPSDWSLTSHELEIRGDWRRTIKEAYLLTHQIQNNILVTPTMHPRGRKPDWPVLVQISNQLCQSVFWDAKNAVSYHTVPKTDKDGNPIWKPNKKTGKPKLDKGGNVVQDKQRVRVSEVADYDGKPVDISYFELESIKHHNEERVDDLIANFDRPIAWNHYETPGIVKTHASGGVEWEPKITGGEALLVDLSHAGVLPITWDTPTPQGKFEFHSAAAYLEFDCLLDYVKFRPMLTPASMGDFYRNGVEAAVGEYFRIHEIGYLKSVRGFRVLTFGKYVWNGPTKVIQKDEWFDLREIDMDVREILQATLKALPHRPFLKGQPNQPSIFRRMIRSTILLNVIAGRPIFEGVFDIPRSPQDFKAIVFGEGDGLKRLSEFMTPYEIEVVDAIEDAIHRKIGMILSRHPNKKQGYEAIDKWRDELYRKAKMAKSTRQIRLLISSLFVEVGSAHYHDVRNEFITRTCTGGKSIRSLRNMAHDLNFLVFMALAGTRSKKSDVTTDAADVPDEVVSAA